MATDSFREECYGLEVADRASASLSFIQGAYAATDSSSMLYRICRLLHDNHEPTPPSLSQVDPFLAGLLTAGLRSHLASRRDMAIRIAKKYGLETVPVTASAKKEFARPRKVIGAKLQT